MSPTLVKSFVVFAFLALVSARDDKCTTVAKGDLNHIPVQLPRLNLPPYQQKWDLSISQPCDVVGMMMKVCDPDSPPVPTLDVLSTNEVIVTRNGNPIQHSATVDTTVFCKFDTHYVGSVRAVPLRV
ncbi:hypothetical protein evm_012439 [Chilo suppressalis]|nr:hypothetical protein evm_012439 [Chilo suppressalis]